MRLGAPIYAVLWCLELLAGRLECRKEGHLWDCECPKGPLGFDPCRCWRCQVAHRCEQKKGQKR